MAQHTVVQLVDDISGNVLGEGEGRTVQFALNGDTYEIDLSHTEANKLEKAMTKYVEHGRKVSLRATNVSPIRGGGRRSQASADKEQIKAIRQWGMENGFNVSERGRIPQSVVEAYHARATG